MIKTTTRIIYSLLLILFLVGQNVSAQDTDYTNLIINNDFELAPDANCNPISIVADMDGWLTNAWRPTSTSCIVKQFYGWTWQVGFVNESGANILGNNSQGINQDFENINGSYACWIGGNYLLPTLTEFYQIIDKDKLSAGTYKVQCRLGVEEGKRTSQRLFANNNVQYHGTASQYAKNLTEGERSTFAGWGSNVKLGQEMVVYTTITDDEPLRIGIRTGSIKGDGSMATKTSPMWGWFKVDYFRLTKLDPAKTKDATLTSLNLSAGDLNFSPEITTYNVQLPAGVKQVTATAIPTMQGVAVNGAGTVDVSSGTGISTIIVTAPDGVTTKTYTINYTVETGAVIQEQNLLPHWDANGLGLNQTSVANTEMWRWGWNTTNLTSYPWGLANQANTTRFCDMPTVYTTATKNGVAYVGRFAQLRWDGTGGSTAYTTLGYGDGTATASGVPAAIQLEEGYGYNFSFWGFGNEGSAYAAYVTTDPTGADQTKTIASMNISELSNHTTMKLFSLNFNCPKTAPYYMVFKYVSGTASILFIADVDLHKITIPTANAATDITKTGFMANWTSVPGATTYQLDVAADNSFTSFVAGYNNKTVTATSETIAGLADGTTYYYRVRAAKDAVPGANSNVVSITTIAATAPVAPVVGEPANVGPQSFTTSWNAVAGAISYKLDVATDNAFTKTVLPYNNLNVTATSQEITGLQPNTTYYCRVRAYNGSNSPYSNTVSMKTQKLLIVLMAGQSNMAGRGVYSQLAPADTVTYSNILSLNKDSVWVRAKHPLHWDKAEAAVGMGISFAKTLADKIGGNVAIGLVPCAAGGTNINAWLANDWFANTGNFYLYTNLITRAKKATQSGDIIGMIWHQGEANASSLTTPTYQEKMITLFTNIRSDLNLPAMPIVAGELGRYLTYTYLNETNAAINGLSAILPNYAAASSLGLTPNSDVLHFTAASQVEFGKRYANLFYPIYVNSVSAVDNNVVSKIKLNVVNNVLHVNTGNNNPTTVHFYNTLGCKIKTCVVSNSENEIPIPNIKGVCLVSVQNSEGTISQKILY